LNDVKKINNKIMGFFGLGDNNYEIKELMV
jgi:hypothetical protein